MVPAFLHSLGQKRPIENVGFDPKPTLTRDYLGQRIFAVRASNLYLPYSLCWRKVLPLAQFRMRSSLAVSAPPPYKSAVSALSSQLR